MSTRKNEPEADAVSSQRTARRWLLVLLGAGIAVACLVVGLTDRDGERRAGAVGSSGVVTETSASPPAPGDRVCTDKDIVIQGAFVAPLSDEPEPGLLIRIFRSGNGSCWLAGYPEIQLRTEKGIWQSFAQEKRQGGPVTNGPEWSGVFTPDLVAVTTAARSAEKTSAPAERYNAVRVRLPHDGGELTAEGFNLELATSTLVVSAFEADSQDY